VNPRGVATGGTRVLAVPYAPSARRQLGVDLVAVVRAMLLAVLIQLTRDQAPQLDRIPRALANGLIVSQRNA
jgi:hypothetical protein